MPLCCVADCCLCSLVVPQLSASGLLGNTELSVGAAIACFLAQAGADINYANHKGKSPLDLVADSTVLQLIKSFSEKHRYVALMLTQQSCVQVLAFVELKVEHN